MARIRLPKDGAIKQKSLIIIYAISHTIVGVEVIVLESLPLTREVGRLSDSEGEKILGCNYLSHILISLIDSVKQKLINKEANHLGLLLYLSIILTWFYYNKLSL